MKLSSKNKQNQSKQTLGSFLENGEDFSTCNFFFLKVLLFPFITDKTELNLFNPFSINVSLPYSLKTSKTLRIFENWLEIG